MDNLVHLAGLSSPADPRAAELRFRISACGAIEPAGFAAAIHDLARELQLGGSVSYSTTAAFIDVEGRQAALQAFLERFPQGNGHSVLAAMEVTRLDPAGHSQFRIQDDLPLGLTEHLQPDLAVCPDCAAETLDPSSRYQGYGLTSCPRCGPRFSIAAASPSAAEANGDSNRCPSCRSEQEQAGGRRFRSVASTCPACGPPLAYCPTGGGSPAGDPLDNAGTLLKEGGILAIQVVGGFQLLADAMREDVVERLRRRLKRDERPLAVLFPSLDELRNYCAVTAEEREALESPARPAVLLRSQGARLASSVSRSSPYIAASLPATPLQHLLAARFGKPLVAVKASRGDEPPPISPDEARERLMGVADAILSTGARIARPCEDSVVQVIQQQTMVLRRSRGFVPLPVYVARVLPPLLAVGGHRSNAVAVTRGNAVMLSAPVGLLDNLNARVVFHHAIDDLIRLFAVHPEFVACDLHPDYYPGQYAAKCGLPTVRVQHHEAHVAGCAAENDVLDPYLGVAWDGGGYGWDGSIWGGEFFWVESGRVQRCAHLRPFPLLGGDKTIREGWRVAGAMLDACGISCGVLGPSQARIIAESLPKSAAATRCCAAGRLFDAIAAIAGVTQENHYDGQAARMLEWAADGAAVTSAYPFSVDTGNPMLLDWRPTVEAAWKDRLDLVEASVIAAKFHQTLGQAVEAVASRLNAPRVVLSGGVFQNRVLVASIKRRLEANRRRVYTHQRIPPNDGGLAFGQAVLAAGKMSCG
jgi:hydrogenase maturation protein HypF